MSDQQLIVKSSSGKTPAENSLGSSSRVTFGLGSSVFSINASQVSEIIQPLAVTPLPNCPKSIEGVAVLRGELIALLNIRSIVKIPQASASKRSKWIVLSASPGSTQFAFPVDRLVEVAAVGRASGDSSESSRTDENRPLLAVKKPDFPVLDIHSIIEKIESALHQTI